MYTFGVTGPGAVDSAALGTPAAAPDDTMVGAVVVAASATAPAATEDPGPEYPPIADVTWSFAPETAPINLSLAALAADTLGGTLPEPIPVLSGKHGGSSATSAGLGIAPAAFGGVTTAPAPPNASSPRSVVLSVLTPAVPGFAIVVVIQEV